MTDKEKREEKNMGEMGKGMTTSFLCCTLNMLDSDCLTQFRANLPDSCTCIKSASFSWFVLLSIPNKRSLVVKLFKFAGKYLYLTPTKI